jgi:hypothetical protein
MDNIIENTKSINSQTANPRLKYVMDELVDHLHAFARKTRLTTEEWRAGLQFLTECGQMCSDDR